MKELVRRLKKSRAVIAALLAVLIFCSGVSVSAGRGEETAAVSGEITSWGLSFGEDGTVPVGNSDEESLAAFDAYFRIPTEEKTIYLTFDAGYENGNTEKILEALKKHNVKATFFLVGNYFKTRPELVKKMVSEGHTVANHTLTHPDMSAIMDEEAFETELLENEKLYEEITGEKMKKIYRPPQGKYCEKNLEMAKALGYKTVFWSLAYVDWYESEQPTKEEAFSKLLPRIHPGAIVLLHSTSKTNADILDELLSKWEEMGYSFGDLESVLLDDAAAEDSGVSEDEIKGFLD